MGPVGPPSLSCHYRKTTPPSRSSTWFSVSMLNVPIGGLLIGVLLWDGKNQAFVAFRNKSTYPSGVSDRGVVVGYGNIRKNQHFWIFHNNTPVDTFDKSRFSFFVLLRRRSGSGCCFSIVNWCRFAVTRVMVSIIVGGSLMVVITKYFRLQDKMLPDRNRPMEICCRR